MRGFAIGWIVGVVLALAISFAFGLTGGAAFVVGMVFGVFGPIAGMILEEL